MTIKSFIIYLRFILILILFFSFETIAAYNLTKEEIKALKLPIVEINTINHEEPTCDYVKGPEGSLGQSITNATKVPGSVRVENPNGEIIYESSNYVKDESGMTIKIRGNGTAYSSQKPYKIKLQKKGDLLGRNDKNFNDKNWVLIKDGDFKQYIGLNVSKLIGEEWTPQGMHVNVIFNGDYRGMYLLLESIERNEKCRIDVSNTGFIIEHDAYWWNENGEYILSQFYPYLSYTFKYPDFEDLSEDQLECVTEVVQKYENALANGTYNGIIDIDSYVKWILAHDILGTDDGAGSNMYISKYDNSSETLLKVGPLWDFDAIMLTPEDWSKIHAWTSRFQSFFTIFNSPYLKKYITFWEENGEKIINSLIDLTKGFTDNETWEAINLSLDATNKRWNVSHKSLDKLSPTYSQWFDDRLKWLNSKIAEYKNMTGPDGDDSNNIKDILNDNKNYTIIKNGIIPLNSNSEIRIYNINGQEILKASSLKNHAIIIPTPGIYIIHYDNNIFKLSVRN